ncbi:MAG: multidrug ABC transporter [Gemmatimonadetes bacterium]|nr:multidrug ABC transporter [Gemmatimonadota bacterium]
MIRGVVRTAVTRRVTVLMVALAATAFGVVGFSRLPLDLLPDITYPSITVRTEYPDTAPAEVEYLVTRPVEETVGVMRGLREIHSISRSGVSEVTLEFGWGADMDELSMDVREKLDRLQLPEEVEDPIVLRYDPALDPVMRMALTGSDDLAFLRRVAEEEVKESLETIPGVAAARIKGGLEEEIRVDLRQGRLAALGVEPSEVARVLAASNVNQPGGALESKESRYLVRTLNEYETVEEIGELAVSGSGGAVVRLRDVAEVVRGSKDREEITRVDGRESVEIAVYKEGDGNAVAVSASVREKIALIEEALPDGMEVVVLFDQARFIRRSIREVRGALLLGGLLAIAVLFFFLRDARPTLVIATSIPLSIVVTFILMYRMGVSLNIMSLGGLTLGIGMLVDASIVVLEAIHRKRADGLSRAAAAIEGTCEVGGAVAASVLTTVAVFLPIVFVEGIAGQLFRDQALTVTASLVASLVVALTVIPMLSSLGGGGTTKPGRARKTGRGTRVYERFLHAVLDRRGLTLGVASLLFLAAVAIVPRLGRELVPELTEGEFHFEVTLPEGTPLTVTDRVMASMEEAARAEPGVARVFSSVGSRLVAGGLSMKTQDENLGQVDVVMENRTDSDAEALAAAHLREQYAAIPDLSTRLARPSFFSLSTPVELVFHGEDLDALAAYLSELLPRAEAIPGFVDARSSLESGNPELSVVFDRDRLASLGLTVRDVSDALHHRVMGTVASRFREAERHIDIRMRNREIDRDSIEDIENLIVSERGGIPIKLSAVAELEAARGPSEIHRIQQGRAAILAGEVSGRSLGAVSEDLAGVVRAFPPPAGISWEEGGQNREMSVSFDSLRFALLLAVFLVYLVMAGTFENLLHPLLILFTLPLALVGIVAGLGLGGHTLNVISLLGTIFLAGVVVNNAIVLVDAINRNRRQGMETREAVVEAALVRLRPIVMTTLTTVLGLVPMAVSFGEGSELRAPLAMVVIAGLAVGTLLTLAVIPALYLTVPGRVSEEGDLAAELAAAEAGTPEAAS